VTLEQKIIKAKEKRHSQFIKVAIGLITVSLLCIVIVLFLSFGHVNDDEAEIVDTDTSIETKQNSVSVSPTLSPPLPDEQLRQAYISALSEYENILKPELNKIDLTKWDQARSQSLVVLEDEALSKFSVADYAGAVSSIEELKQLAQAMITDSQREFEQALSNAQIAYDADQYDDAKFQVANALMLDHTSVEAMALSTKIEQLPEILTLLEQINTAKIENKPEKELGFIKELLKLAPEREAVVERKQVLIDTINNKNFKSYIAQSYQAIKQGDTGKAKQKIIAAKKIFPNRQEIGDVVTALQKLDKKQRIETYLQSAQMAISSDDWVTAKKQLELASREQADDKAIQKSLVKASTIIALNNEFEQQINNPYRLANMQLASRMKDKINEASAFVDSSPSLNNRTNELSHLIESMNKKISVEIVSDNQTNILVRGVGVVGITQLKTIQLTPGRYTFEGKRKGFKSKLMDVLIPYDQTTYNLSISCDEPI
jgi:hypothetical protein